MVLTYTLVPPLLLLSSILMNMISSLYILIVAKPKAKAKPKTKSTASSGDAKSASPAKRSNVGGGTKASSGSPARKKKAGDKKPWEFDDNDSDSLGLSDSDDDIKPKSAPTREKAAGSRACEYSMLSHVNPYYIVFVT